MEIADVSSRIPQAMLRDQHGLRQRLRAVENLRRLNKPWQDFLARIHQELNASISLSEARRQRLPTPAYPPELPVSERRSEIADAIAKHQVVVVCGETGSGKTTQLPKICLELGRGVAGMIGHTQPRRIAARSVAARVAEELGTKVGDLVSYKIRFSDTTASSTYVKLMTDGILLAETQADRFLTQYDTIIIDEAHERSLNIDFLLGYLKTLLPKRPDLKLIITSATIDPERFSEHFDGCPMVMVSGRTYPVEVLYRDPHAPKRVEQEEDGETVMLEELDEDEPDLMQAILDAVDELAARGPGDMLIFLSGEREIREAADALAEHLRQPAEIIPLYARLSAEEQQRVFQPGRRRRIVLATNVAETSLTVPGIRYVIDPGLARISRYSPRTKVQRLPIEPVSQASANQRKGRCGRLGPGVCVRLYSEENFLARPMYTEPEILRTNLASVILQMKFLRLGNIEDFPFLERPSAKGILDGYQTLVEIGAVDAKWNLTPLGAQLARLPIDPRIARIILAGEDEGCQEEVLIIAAALSVQDPRERPLDKQDAADAAHAPFRDGYSDFLSFLNLWKWYHEQARHLSTNKLRKACQASFLSFTRMREWHDIHQQLTEMLAELKADRPRVSGRVEEYRHGQRRRGRPKRRARGAPPPQGANRDVNRPQASRQDAARTAAPTGPQAAPAMPTQTPSASPPS